VSRAVEFRFYGGHILHNIALEQLPLFRAHRFILDPVADAPEVSDFLNQCLNLDLLRAVDFGKTGYLVITRLNLRLWCFASRGWRAN